MIQPLRLALLACTLLAASCTSTNTATCNDESAGISLKGFDTAKIRRVDVAHFLPNGNFDTLLTVDTYYLHSENYEIENGLPTLRNVIDNEEQEFTVVLPFASRSFQIKGLDREAQHSEEYNEPFADGTDFSCSNEWLSYTEDGVPRLWAPANKQNIILHN